MALIFMGISYASARARDKAICEEWLTAGGNNPSAYCIEYRQTHGSPSLVDEMISDQWINEQQMADMNIDKSALIEAMEGLTFE